MKNSLVIILMIFGLSLVGCKEDVSFNAVEDSQNDGQGNRPVEPVEPPEPPEVIPPFVKILKQAEDHKWGQATDVVFEVIPGDNEIESVICLVNQDERECDAEKGQVVLKDMDLGDHVFEVIVEDVEGMKASANDDWSVLSLYEKKNETLKVDDKRSKTDILFVIDNSGSMRFEQTKMSKRFDKFIEQVRGLDWHIGITTTDADGDEDWSNGKLHQFPEGPHFLTPDLGEQRAQKMFAKHVKRSETGNDHEEGIEATFRSIERAVRGTSSADDVLRQFYRRDAALAVVVVSDENESSSHYHNLGSNLLKYIKNKWGNNKIFQFNSIIVHTQSCLQGAGQIMGYAYEELSRVTNGTVGDICADNYSRLLKDIGKGVANLQKVHKLKCVPQDNDDDGKVDLVIVAKSGAPVPGYTIDENKITFDSFLNPDEYEFSYYCLAD